MGLGFRGLGLGFRVWGGCSGSGFLGSRRDKLCAFIFMALAVWVSGVLRTEYQNTRNGCERQHHQLALMVSESLP